MATVLVLRVLLLLHWRCMRPATPSRRGRTTATAQGLAPEPEAIGYFRPQMLRDYAGVLPEFCQKTLFGPPVNTGYHLALLYVLLVVSGHPLAYELPLS